MESPKLELTRGSNRLMRMAFNEGYSCMLWVIEGSQCQHDGDGPRLHVFSSSIKVVCRVDVGADMANSARPGL